MNLKKGHLFAFLTSLPGNHTQDTYLRIVKVEGADQHLEWPKDSILEAIGNNRIQAKGFFDGHSIAVIKMDTSLTISKRRGKKSLKTMWEELSGGKLGEEQLRNFLAFLEALVDQFYPNRQLEHVNIKLFIHWGNEYWRGGDRIVQSLSRQDEKPLLIGDSSYQFDIPQQDAEGIVTAVNLKKGFPGKTQAYHLEFHRYSTYQYDGPQVESKRAFENWQFLQKVATVEELKRHFLPPHEEVRREFRKAEEHLLGHHKLQAYLLENSKKNFDLDEVNKKWEQVLDLDADICEVPLRFRDPLSQIDASQPSDSQHTITLTTLSLQPGETLRVRYVYLACHAGHDSRKRFPAFVPDHPSVLVPLQENAAAAEKTWESNLINLFEETIRRKFDFKVEHIPFDKEKEMENGDERPHLLIALALMEDFNNSEVYDRLASRRSFIFNNEQLEGHLDFDYVPVITIGLMNVMAYYHDQEEYSSDLRRKAIRNAYKVYLRLRLDARFRFFDSSIWFQYVALTQHFARDLRLAVHNFRYNLEANIYNSAEAVEFLEFQLRNLRNSYVVNLAAKDEKKSASFITPFAFHPESRMRRHALEEFASIQGIPWKLLLVDDQATQALSKRTGVGEELEIPSKEEVIKACLDGAHFPEAFRKKRSFPVTDKSRKGPDTKLKNKGEREQPSKILILESEEDIRRAFEKISGLDWFKEELGPSEPPNRGEDDHFNAILLNYLFEYDGKRVLSFAKSEYGFRMIRKLSRWIYRSLKNDYRRDRMLNRLGPMQRMHFLPISIYMEVMQGKLKDLGIPSFHQYWEIGSGVDPICTPQLFRYHLFYMLRRQLGAIVSLKSEEAVQQKLSDKHKLRNFFNKAYWDEYLKKKAPKSLMLTLVNRIVKAKRKKEQLNNVQYAALQQFPAFVELGTTFKTLYQYRDNRYAHHLIDRYFFGFDAYAWDHLQHLIYLLTYGTFQQKQEMWEEYIYLSQIVNKKQYQLIRDRKRQKIQQEEFEKLKKGLAEIADYVTQLGNYNK